MTDKKNISLIIGLAIPVLMIVFVAASIYLPRLGAPDPQYDFLYSLNEDPYYGEYYSYVVRDGKLIRQQIQTDPSIIQKGRVEPVSPTLYLHDIETNKSAVIAFEDAAKLPLDGTDESPDGFQVRCGRRSNIFDSYEDCRTQYIVGHRVSEKLNVKSTTNYGGLRFLGWVIQPQNE